MDCIVHGFAESDTTEWFSPHREINGQKFTVSCWKGKTHRVAAAVHTTVMIHLECLSPFGVLKNITHTISRKKFCTFLAVQWLNTLCSQCRGYGCNPWSGNYDPTCYMAPPKKMIEFLTDWRAPALESASKIQQWINMIRNQRALMIRGHGIQCQRGAASITQTNIDYWAAASSSAWMGLERKQRSYPWPQGL